MLWFAGLGNLLDAPLGNHRVVTIKFLFIHYRVWQKQKVGQRLGEEAGNHGDRREQAAPGTAAAGHRCGSEVKFVA